MYSNQPAASLADVVTDGVHEMRFPQPRPPVDIERVVGLGGALRHCPRRCLSELIAGADHERFKRVGRTQHARTPFVPLGGIRRDWSVFLPGAASCQDQNLQR